MTYNKLSREKTFKGENFCEFRSFVAVHKSFLHKIWERGVLWRGTSEQSMKVFPAKIVIFTNLRKFSLLKVSRYTVESPSYIHSTCLFTTMGY